MSYIETRKRRRKEGDWRCGWCKGFIKQHVSGTTWRWVHEETPVTPHEVLPYQEASTSVVSGS